MARPPEPPLSAEAAASQLLRLRALDHGARHMVEGTTFVVWGLALFGIMLSFVVFPFAWAGFVWVVGVALATMLTYTLFRAAAVHLPGPSGDVRALAAVSVAVTLAFGAYTVMIFLGVLAFWIPFDLIFVSAALGIVPFGRVLSPQGARWARALSAWGLIVSGVLLVVDVNVLQVTILQALAFLMWSVAGARLALRG